MQPAAAPAPKKSKVLLVVIVLGVGLVLAVPCIGIISAIAIPAFVGYVKRSKITEATSEVRAIARSEMTYCSEHGGWLVPAGPTPAVPGPAKQLGDFSSDPVFTQLGYDRPDPVYYSYSIERDPAVTGGIRVVARGDLDGDGIQSTFTVACGSDCECDPAPVVTDELE